MRRRQRSTAFLVFAAFASLATIHESSCASEAVIRNEGANFGVIVEKDLFRPSREKPIAERPGPKPGPARPPQRPAPEVTITGTVILDTGGVAMLSWHGDSSGSGAYRVGDRIEEFVIVDITRDTVVLKRGEEVLRASMSGGRKPAADRTLGQRSMGAFRNLSPAVPRGGVQSDMPVHGKAEAGNAENGMEEIGGNEWAGK